MEIELLAGQRQSDESDKAVQACNDWLRMGSGRSIPSLLAHYKELSTFQRGFEPPSDKHRTLYTWASNYDWASRSTEYDASWERRKNAEHEAVLNYGLALEHERVKELYRLATFLKAQIYERGEGDVFHNVWLPDVKSIGSGEFAIRVDIERFNSPLIEQYRKVLEDIAKETGGRVDRSDVTSGGQPLTGLIIDFGDDNDTE